MQPTGMAPPEGLDLARLQQRRRLPQPASVVRPVLRSHGIVEGAEPDVGAQGSVEAGAFEFDGGFVREGGGDGEDGDDVRGAGGGDGFVDLFDAPLLSEAVGD
jgi:hypothetical protein